MSEKDSVFVPFLIMGRALHVYLYSRLHDHQSSPLLLIPGYALGKIEIVHRNMVGVIVLT